MKQQNIKVTTSLKKIGIIFISPFSILWNFLPIFTQFFSFSFKGWCFKRNAFVFNVAKWKRREIKRFFPEYKLHFLPIDTDLNKKELLFKMFLRKQFIVWGRSTPVHIREFAELHKIPIYHIEDGFVRSIGLGANHVPPLSVCIDKRGLYYDSSNESDLEYYLNYYDFSVEELKDAQQCLDRIRDLKISKYNEIDSSFAEKIYGPKIIKRILVLGQVEDDQSLLWGCNRILSNAQFLNYVIKENPNAQIIYKPHPDVISGLRKEIDNLDHLKPFIEVLSIQVSLYDALYEVDVVYTMTSLGGFEALIHGVPVVTYGAPFYSGWGLTKDIQIVERRKRIRSLLEVFAAAYILYPRYKLGDSNHTSLARIIDDLQEQLEFRKQENKEQYLEDLSFVNLSTTHAVNARFITNSLEDRILVVTDSTNILKIARDLMLFDKKVTILTTRDVDANNYKMLTSVFESTNIEVLSIHKKYSLPMSETEKASIDLGNIFGMCLGKVIDPIVGEVINKDIQSEFVLALKDYIYFETLRFNAAKDLVVNYDKCILAFEDSEFSTTRDIFKAIQYHAENLKKLGKVYLVSLMPRDQTNYLSSKQMFKKINNEGACEYNFVPISDIRDSFLSWWWEIQNKKYNQYLELDQPVMVCGNIADLNYAYSPASLFLVKTVNENTKSPLIFFNSGLMGEAGLNEVKMRMIDMGVSHKCFAYNGNYGLFKTKYPEEVVAKAENFKIDIANNLKFELSKVISHKLLNIFEPRLAGYSHNLMLNIFFVSEAMAIAQNSITFATSMDRSPLSRILAHISRKFSVSSFGIQPQIISESPRYEAPAVDVMGVIDHHQVKVYENLGAKSGSLKAVGSVNIQQRLLQLKEESLRNIDELLPKNILFAMQHSSSFEMISTAEALANICQKHGYFLMIKPHPHQEMPVLNRVRTLMAGRDCVQVMTRESDTYAALAKSKVVVSLFSSVLLESSLYRKGTVISAFRDIHPSIDFSKNGLALKALNVEQLEQICVDLVEGGVLSKQLAETQEHFLQNNPQFLPPYTLDCLEKFIIQHLH